MHLQFRCDFVGPFGNGCSYNGRTRINFGLNSIQLVPSGFGEQDSEGAEGGAGAGVWGGRGEAVVVSRASAGGGRGLTLTGLNERDAEGEMIQPRRSPISPPNSKGWDELQSVGS